MSQCLRSPTRPRLGQCLWRAATVAWTSRVTCHVSQYCHVSGYLGQRHGAVVHGDRGGHHELGEVAEAARAEDVQDALRGGT